MELGSAAGWTPPEDMVTRSLAALEKSFVNSSEPLMFQFVGVVQAIKAHTLLKKGDKIGAAVQQCRAALTFYEGADAPTLVPLSDTRYWCRAMGMMIDHGLIAELRKEQDAAIQKEVQDAQDRLDSQVMRFVQDGRKYPAARAKVLSAQVRNHSIYDAKTLDLQLRDWEIHESRNPTPGILRVQMLLGRRNFGAALDEAGNLLVRFPVNPILTQLRQEAQKGIIAEYLPKLGKTKT